MSKLWINGFGRIGRLVLRRLLEARQQPQRPSTTSLLKGAVPFRLALRPQTTAPSRGASTLLEDVPIATQNHYAYALRGAAYSMWRWCASDCGVYRSTPRPREIAKPTCAGARKVLISRPPPAMKTTSTTSPVMTPTPDDTIISVASRTTNCLKFYGQQDAFGITVGTMTTIHACYRHPVAGGRAAEKICAPPGRRRKTLSRTLPARAIGS